MTRIVTHPTVRADPPATRPRLGFLGTGWIGRHRMEAILATGLVDAVAIADPSPAMMAEARALAPDAAVVASLDEMLALAPDGVVIATPSAQHAAQAIQALRAGAAIFCQKPLGRSGPETASVVAAARTADRLLGVDFSYRHTAGMVRIADLVRRGDLGSVQLVDLTFHNAYGPDKSWFYDRTHSGGGCLIDLGVHLVDLALWTLSFPDVIRVEANLFAGGAPLTGDAVEDLALATLTLAGGAVIRLGCSWRLHAGQPAEIAASFYGTAGGATLRNVGGSFYDFTAARLHGTERETLTAGPDEWGGRAAVHWVERLAAGARFDAAAEEITAVATVLDRIYKAGAAGH